MSQVVFKLPKGLDSFTDFFSLMAADDGVEHRSNRRCLFDPYMNQIGIGIQADEQYLIVVLIFTRFFETNLQS
jgi:hypothetical protein